MSQRRIVMLFLFQFSLSILTSCFGSLQVVKASNPNSVYSAPMVEILPNLKTDYIIKELQTLTIKCIAKGHPKPSIKWTIYAGALARRNLDLHNSTMTISNISRAEGGRITCRASNGKGSPAFATRRIRVIYLDTPALTIRIPSKGSVPSTSIWLENTVDLQCEVLSNPPASFFWKKDKSSVYSSNEKGLSIRRISPYKPFVSISVLRIKNAQRRDYGNYECSATLGEVGKTVSISDTKNNFIYSIKNAPPQIRLKTPANVAVNKGDTIRMSCCANGGFPNPKINWMREDGAELPGRAKITKRSTLVIPNATYSDSGNYVCVGNNRVGIPTQKKVKVTIRRLDSMTYWITPLRGDRRLDKGTDVRLSCYADGEPSSELRYSWYKLDSQNNRVVVKPHLDKRMSIVKLKQEEAKKGLVIPAMTSRLEILTLKKEDYGVYICSATLLGYHNRSLEVFARIPISKDSAPPEITVTRHDIVAQEGSNVTLTCQANGKPLPTFRFYRTENASMSNGRNEEFSLTGHLTLTNINREDAGTYLCSAARFNGFSKFSRHQSEALIEVKVEYPPTVEPSYKLVRKPRGAALNLTCFVLDTIWDDRPITFRWMKDGSLEGQLQGSEQMYYPSIDNGRYGIYTCIVSNKVGSSRCVINVTGAAYPPEFYYSDQDRSFFKFSDDGGSYSYLLSWTQKRPDAVETVIQYRIMWRLSGQDTDWKEGYKDIPSGPKDGMLITFNMENLEPGQYEVEVTPRTGYMDGTSATRTIQVKPRTSDVYARNVSPTTHTLDADFYCDFDYNNVCTNKFIQATDDNLDWSLNSAETQSKRTEKTGPDTDYTTFDREGGYMYIESSNVEVGDKARLITPTFYHSTSQKHCLKFYYHMRGRHIGILRVLMLENARNETELWMKQKEQGNSWISALVNIYPKDEYQIIFEATMTEENGYQGDIAIDDVIVEGEECVHTTTSISLLRTTPRGGNAELQRGSCNLLSGSLWKIVYVLIVILFS